MYIKISKHDGTFVEDVQTSEMNLSKTIENVKKKYPKDKYHATLVTY